VLKRLLVFSPEIEILLIEKGKIVAESSDKKWFKGLTLLGSISCHFICLNIKLQGQ
jgi:hypothetical protein